MTSKTKILIGSKARLGEFTQADAAQLILKRINSKLNRLKHYDRQTKRQD